MDTASVREAPPPKIAIKRYRKPSIFGTKKTFGECMVGPFASANTILSPKPFRLFRQEKLEESLKDEIFSRDTPPKTNMTMGKRTIWRCISTTKNGDFPASHVSFLAKYINIPWSELWRFSFFRGNPPGSEEETFKTTEQTRFVAFLATKQHGGT